MFADVGVTLGTNSLGTFQLDAATWTYTLDQAAAQNVDAGDSDQQLRRASRKTRQVASSIHAATPLLPPVR